MNRKALTQLVFACLAILTQAASVSQGQVQQRLTDTASVQSPLDTLVICPPAFQHTMQRWIHYRARQGHKIMMVASAPTAYENRLLVRNVVKQHPQLKFVLLVGDSGDSRYSRTQQVPTDFIKAKVNVKFGSDAEIATDNTFADTDADGLPDLAIGRLPVDTNQELEQAIERIVRYEGSEVNSQWQRRINLVAGVGGFGQLIDKLIEQTTKQMVTDLIPDPFKTSMTYGSWSSPYCPDPRRFSQTAIERFNEGCLFWVYIGHGNRHRLDKVYLPDQAHRILDVRTCQQLSAREGNPIAVFLACYTGAMDHQRDCLAEEMFRQQNGPVAVIAGSRVTMPYAMGLLSLELLKEYFDGEAKTVGELVRNAKRNMASDDGKKNAYRTMIETMGKLFSPKPELLTEERREHLQLMHLIGDPLLRLKRPDGIAINSPEKADAGSKIVVKGSIEEDTRLQVEIAYRRDRHRFRPPRRKEYDSSDAVFQSYQEAYEKARHLVCFRGMAQVKKGEFAIEVPIPKDANGECVVSVFSADKGNIQMGSAPLFIKAAPRAAQTPKTSDLESR